MNRWIVLIALLICAWPAKATATKDEIGACAVALAPDVTLINSSESVKKSWLVLVTEKTYDSAKKQIQTSGDVELLGLIGASASFDYYQFDEHRREYLNLHQGNYERNTAVSIFQQSLPPRAGENFVDCIRAAATVADGLHVWFSNESGPHAFLHVRFRGVPNTSVNYKVGVVGGTGAPPSGSLPHDGEIQYDITRTPNVKEIRVTVTSTNPTGLTDSAVSVRPGPGVQPPKPTFIPAEIWSPAIAVRPDNSKPCELAIKDRELIVMAYDASSAGLSLAMRGTSVLPQPGTYPLAPSTNSDISVLASRVLDDFSIGAASEIRVTGPQSASAILVKTPASLQGCAHYQMHFSNARIVVKQPSAIFGVGNDILTERYEYKRSGDYPNHWGNIGCPNCGELYAANLTSKTSRPVGSLLAVTFVSQTGSTQWYRCYTITPACETNGEVTATLDRKSGSCLGRETCYSWRFSTDGNEATDTFELKYKEKVCLRYCTR